MSASDTEQEDGPKKAPYISVAWVQRFLETTQRVTPTVVDKAFITPIAPGNEGTVLTALRFLGLINPEGVPTDRLKLLRTGGEERKKYVLVMVNEAYAPLLKEVNVEKAMKVDVKNYFVRTYQYNQNQSDRATALFVYLAREAGLTLSEDFSAPPIPNATAQKTKPSESRQKLPKASTNRSTVGKSVGPVQAIVNIHLDKDTPLELWNRVFRLLGEEESTSE